MKTLLGIVSYGNLPFLKIAVRSVLETATKPIDVGVVVAKPRDFEMIDWLKDQPVKHIVNHYNKGFCGSLNDLLDAAFVNGHYDSIIVMGNDVVPYPGAIDAMIECAETTKHEWICASQYDVKQLCKDYPVARSFYEGPNYTLTDFSSRPWELNNEAVKKIKPEIREQSKSDVQNLCLFKRSVFETIGYFDVPYWPNGYFSDNSYCRKADLAGVDGCSLPHAVYFHAWSRTIHQSDGKRDHDRHFRGNEAFYISQWGGRVGREKFSVPFGGRDLRLSDDLVLPGKLKIDSRKDEAALAAYFQADAARR